MQAIATIRAEETACQPEWVQRNHLFSVCTRALAPLAGVREGVPGTEGDVQRCMRKHCLFGAKTP